MGELAVLLNILRSLERSRHSAEVRFLDGEAYVVRVGSTAHAEEGGDVIAHVLQPLSAAGLGMTPGAWINFYLADVSKVLVSGRRIYPK